MYLTIILNGKGIDGNEENVEKGLTLNPGNNSLCTHHTWYTFHSIRVSSNNYMLCVFNYYPSMLWAT